VERGGIRDSGIAGYSPESLIRSIVVLVVGATEQFDKSKSVGMSTEQFVATGLPVSVKSPRRPPGRGHLRRSDFRWSIAFVAPYAAVLLAFVVYPFGYALWMASKPSLYADLIPQLQGRADDPSGF